MPRQCPQCGSGAAWTKFVTHTFPYGHPESVALTVPLFPVGRCEDCEEEWYDSEGADMIDATVTKYKQILCGG